VTRSVLVSETMALADAFDTASPLKYDIEMITSYKIPTDSLSLFDVITKALTTAEKRLMIDLSVLKQAYDRREVENIGFVRTEHNPADMLTKVTRCTILHNILCSGQIHHPVEQWVDRRL
jgi:hypothetical protein